jgi:hypothetical protein
MEEMNIVRTFVNAIMFPYPAQQFFKKGKKKGIHSKLKKSRT